MTTATLREVQHNLARYLRVVEVGGEVIIRRRTKPVARLAPLHPPSPVPEVDWSDMVAWRKTVWKGHPTPGTPVERLVAEARGER